MNNFTIFEPKNGEYGPYYMGYYGACIDSFQVKLCQLNEAASKVAAEIADFETPWFQSLKLMVDAAGVTFEDEFVPVEGIQMNQEISDRVIKVLIFSNNMNLFKKMAIFIQKIVI